MTCYSKCMDSIRRHLVLLAVLFVAVPVAACGNQRDLSPGGDSSVPVDLIWGCLGNIEEPMPVPGETHAMSFSIVDSLTRETPAGLTVRLCAQVDLNCDAPLEEELTPGADGHITVTVPSGFQGYLETDAPDLMPSLILVGPVVNDSTDVGEEVRLERTVVVDSIARAADIPVDPTKGHIFSLLAGCDGFGHAGVSFTHEPTASGEAFYLMDLGPDQDAPSSDESGQSGIFNLDPGLVTITTTRAESGEFIGTKRAPIRAGFMTYVTLSPTAAP